MNTTTSVNSMNDSNEAFKNYRRIGGTTSLPYMGSTGTIAIVGIVGNSLTLIVLCKKKQWTSVNLLITFMSVSDMFALPMLFVIPIQLFLQTKVYEGIVYIQDLLFASSSLCAAIIGCERAFAVKKPLQFTEIWNTKLTVRIYIFGMVISAAFVLVRFVLDDKFDIDFFRINVYLPYFVVVRGVPFVVIMVTSVLIVRGLIMNNKSIGKLASNEAERDRIQQEAAITRTMVIMTTVYFLCMIPSRISVGLMYIGIYIDKHYISFHVKNFCEVLNFSINFVLYTTTSRFFRESYTELLCICCRCMRHCTRSSEPSTTHLQFVEL